MTTCMLFIAGLVAAIELLILGLMAGPTTTASLTRRSVPGPR